MSYSRWGCSYFYTFWQCQDEDTENYETAWFNVDCVEVFTSKELREQLDVCIWKIKKNCKKKRGNSQPSDLDIKELEESIEEFLEDVEKEYLSWHRLNKMHKSEVK